MTEHVCPVGALTTKDFRFKARVWFLRTAQERLPGLRDGLQRAPRLRPALQQGVPLPPARQREGQQVLDVRRGDAHVQARRTTAASLEATRRRRATRRSRSALEEAKALFAGVAEGVDRGRPLGAALARGQLGAPRARRRVLIGTSELVRVAAGPTATRTTILIHQRQEPEHARASSELAPDAQAVRSARRRRRRRAR